MEVVYADDLNGYKAFPRRTPNQAVLQEVALCKTELHKWGRANSVTFDTGKESAHVVCKTEPAGEDFRMLGVLFDGQLTMAAAVRETG